MDLGSDAKMVLNTLNIIGIRAREEAVIQDGIQSGLLPKDYLEEKYPKVVKKKNPRSKDYQDGFIQGVKFSRALFGQQAEYFKKQLEKTIDGFKKTE
jgi:hypothetical protein